MAKVFKSLNTLIFAPIGLKLKYARMTRSSNRLCLAVISPDTSNS
ncbi:hypothetical protein LCGC14_1913150, partial [marine sediment metagenome]